MEDAITIFKRGAIITTSATSANVAMPTDSSGNSPRYVRITASNPSYVALGVSGVVAAAGDFIVQPGDAVVVAVNGATFVAAIQQSAAGVVQISGLDNL